MEEYYFTPIDHSQDVYIHQTKDGKTFAIKDIRLSFSGRDASYTAEVAGDMNTAKEYLKALEKKEDNASMDVNRLGLVILDKEWIHGIETGDYRLLVTVGKVVKNDS